MLPNRKSNLTPEECVQLVSKYREGIPVKDICETFNISRPYFYKILKQTTDELETQQALDEQEKEARATGN